MAEKPKRIFVRSYGCSSNLADGEFLSGCLSQAGYEITDEITNSDILIYNTCAVKTPTENRVIEDLKQAAKSNGKKLIVTGCLPLINMERLKKQVKFDAITGPAPGSEILEVVRKVSQGEKLQRLPSQTETKPRLDLPKRSLNPVTSVIPVAYGCLGSCSYCGVVFARGRLRSCRPEEVIQRVQGDIDLGAKEIWLTAQDMACYGKDLGQNLVDLLKAVCAAKGEFFVRVGMMTPNHVLDMLDELVEAFRNEHVFKFLHLPVQSGDNQVLKRMNRYYSVEDFQKIVNAFRAAVNDVTVSTDVICGFPGESDEAFENTLRLIDHVNPDVVNVSKFFPRPSTIAARMTPQVSPSVLTDRSRRLTELVRGISAEKNKAWMNWTGRILVDEHGKQPKTWIGRNLSYKPIVIKSPVPTPLGRFLEVRVVKTYQTYLEAMIS